jgi:23S rRNA (guanosine2251-2'-O)-methyltransferase
MKEFVYGVHAISALLKHNPEKIIELFVLDGRQDKRMQALLSRAAELCLPYRELSRKDLDDLTAGAVHQGIVASCVKLQLERNEKEIDKLLNGLERPPFLLILDAITDPHNLGACLRTAEAAGVDAVLVPKDKSAQLNATVRKVACGAAEILPFFMVTNLARTITKLKESGIWVMGAAGEAIQSLYETSLTGPVAIVMGSEGYGMRRLTRAHCDVLFSIPMAGEVSSLNVSVATGVSLFEALRQRRSSVT